MTRPFDTPAEDADNKRGGEPADATDAGYVIVPVNSADIDAEIDAEAAGATAADAEDGDAAEPVARDAADVNASADTDDADADAAATDEPAVDADDADESAADPKVADAAEPAVADADADDADKDEPAAADAGKPEDKDKPAAEPADEDKPAAPVVTYAGVEDYPFVNPLGDPPRRRRKKSAARRVLIVLCVILTVGIVAAAGAYAWWRHSVDVGKRAMTEQVTQRASTEDGVVEYNGKRYRLNDNIVTVCFIGYDDSGDAEDELKGGQSDAVMVLALNTSMGTAKLISIPRDSMVTVDTYSGDSYGGQVTEQICLQYSYGNTASRSSELTTNAVSRLLYSLPINYYFTLNIRGVASLNDSIGGVTLTALQTIPNTNVVEGQQVTLLGSAARAYVQYRDTQGSITSSLDRQERQKQYLKAFVSQLLQTAKSNPAKLIDLYNEAGDYTCTNLGLEEYTYLADSMLSSGFSSLEVTSLDGEMEQGETFAEFYLDKDALRQEVIDTFYIETK